MSAHAGQGHQIVEAREGARQGRHFSGADIVPVDLLVAAPALRSQVQVALPVGLQPVGGEGGGECRTGDQRGVEEATRLQAQLVETRRPMPG